jgi:hypothetical protein
VSPEDIKVDVCVEAGQLLIELPNGVESKRVKQLFWQIGFLLNNSDKDGLQAIGEAIEKTMCNLE